MYVRLSSLRSHSECPLDPDICRSAWSLHEWDFLRVVSHSINTYTKMHEVMERPPRKCGVCDIPEVLRSEAELTKGYHIYVHRGALCSYYHS